MKIYYSIKVLVILALLFFIVSVFGILELLELNAISWQELSSQKRHVIIAVLLLPIFLFYFLVYSFKLIFRVPVLEVDFESNVFSYTKYFRRWVIPINKLLSCSITYSNWRNNFTDWMYKNSDGELGDQRMLNFRYKQDESIQNFSIRLSLLEKDSEKILELLNQKILHE